MTTTDSIHTEVQRIVRDEPATVRLAEVLHDLNQRPALGDWSRGRISGLGLALNIATGRETASLEMARAMAHLIVDASENHRDEVRAQAAREAARR